MSRHQLVLALLVSLAAATSVPTAKDTAPAGKQTVTCPDADWFLCPSSQRCIHIDWRCDGETDCEHGEDEQGCSSGPKQCAETEYHCQQTEGGVRELSTSVLSQLGFAQHCIPKEWLCDGEPDCVNKDDELRCDGSSPDRTTSCKDHQFECMSYDRNVSACIPKDWVCDGQYDCLDMKDEQNCNHHGATCDVKTEFKCDDGQCIYNSWKCDGDSDCGDGSDENSAICAKNVCDDPNKFKCKTGFCIPASWRCDGEPDCADHSDEHECSQVRVNHTVNCAASEFKCANNAQCISKFWKCDGDEDCFDGSDEGAAAGCTTTTPATDEKCKEEDNRRCKNGECVAKAVWCDGLEDCLDGSDEANCSAEATPKVLQCDNATEYQCPITPLRCIKYAELCKTPADDCGGAKTVCNSQILQCQEGKRNCLCRKTGSTGKVCHCPKGYESSGDECIDIDECAGKGAQQICDQLCVNKPGSYGCDCYPGYLLVMPKLGNASAVPSKCRASGPDPMLLLSNRAAIRRYDIVTNKYHPLISKLESAVALDYWLAKHTLIWSDVSREQIMVCHLSNETLSSVSLASINDCVEKGNVTLIDKDITTPDGLAIDWVHGLLFWTDTGRDEISVLDLVTAKRKVLFKEGLDEPRAIAVDPSAGLLFWTDWGQQARIERSGMDGSHRRVIVSGNDVSWPNGLAVDFLDRRIYWADAKRKTISSSDYWGKDVRTVLHSHKHLKHPFSLAVFEEKLYWTDWDQEGVLTVNKFRGNDVQTLMKGVAGPMTVRVYHKQAQPPHPNKCEGHTCDSMCLPRGIFTGETKDTERALTGAPYSCACEVGFTPGADNLCVSTLAGVIALAEGGSGSGTTVTYFLFLVVVASVALLAYGYHRHRPARFSALTFDNPVYRRTVEDLESDVENAADNSLGAISTAAADAKDGGGEVKLVLASAAGDEKPKPKMGSSLVDVRDPHYAYDQPRH